MNELMARLVAITTAVLLAGTLVAVYVTSHPGASNTEVKAEFDDVYPLLPGMHVRIDGAIAGSVGDIDITDHGTALVSLELYDGTAPPRADATAAIRQQDITGDSYVALEPGDASEPLGDQVIGRRDTLVAPRFDDLLNSFDEPVRQGLKLILIELGKGLERRGVDLNEAMLQLRPGLEAADDALTEVRSQNAALHSLIDDAEAVTGQAAAHSHELGGLVDSLSSTLQTTAEHGGALDAAVERLPETASRARVTLGKLANLATESEPLARIVAESAPELAVTFRRLGPFLDDARATMDTVAPTLHLVQNLLTASLPTLREAPARVLTAPLDIAAASGAVLNALLGERKLQEALFSADGYGHGPKAEDDRGLGAVGVETGNQAGYPDDYDKDRRFLRAETVLTCESFGLKIEPGCLDDAIASARHHPTDKPGSSAAGAAEGPAPGDAAGGAPPAAGNGADDGPLGPVGDEVGDVLDQINGIVDGALGHGGHGGGGSDPGDGPDLGAAEDLLDFLSGP